MAEWVAAAPKDADARFQLGTLLFEMDRFADAERTLRAAIELDPSGAAPLPDRCVASPQIGSAQGGGSVEVCRSLETRVVVETVGVAQPCAG